MRIEHRIEQSPAEPKTTKAYGARVRSIQLEYNVVVVYWVIYTHRKRNGGADAKRN